MGYLNYQNLDRYIGFIESGSVFVEIGSDRGEGSTPYLADMAGKYSTVLHTVDIENRRRTKNDRSNVIWHRGRGSEWAANTWPQIGNQIALLFLDNQDWIYDSECDANQASQQEHLSQIRSLLPWVTPSAVIGCDDTYLKSPENIWTGKCALGVPLLFEHGFRLVESTLHSGVIFARELDKRDLSK